MNDVLNPSLSILLQKTQVLIKILEVLSVQAVMFMLPQLIVKMMDPMI